MRSQRERPSIEQFLRTHPNEVNVLNFLESTTELSLLGANDLFRYAIFEGFPKAITKLIEMGCNPNQLLKRSIHLESDTCLHIAVALGNIGVARVLLDKGANINALNNCGATPLHNAALILNPEIYLLLLGWRADPKATTASNDACPHNYKLATPMKCAAMVFQDLCYRAQITDPVLSIGTHPHDALLYPANNMHYNLIISFNGYNPRNRKHYLEHINNLKNRMLDFLSELVANDAVTLDEVVHCLKAIAPEKEDIAIEHARRVLASAPIPFYYANDKSSVNLTQAAFERLYPDRSEALNRIAAQTACARSSCVLQ